jgi:hypothetical protein
LTDGDIKFVQSSGYLGEIHGISNRGGLQVSKNGIIASPELRHNHHEIRLISIRGRYSGVGRTGIKQLSSRP